MTPASLDSPFTCDKCGKAFDHPLDELEGVEAVLLLCSCGGKRVIRNDPALHVQAGTMRSSGNGPSARKVIRFAGSFLYGIILGAVIVASPAIEAGDYRLAATGYISFLMAICKLATALVALLLLLSGLYWGYRLSADGNSKWISFGLPLLALGTTIFPFATTLREYTFTYSNIFLYFLLGVTGTTMVFCTLIIMTVSTDAIVFRVGRVFAVLPFVLFTTLWLTGLGEATVKYVCSEHSLLLKFLVGVCNLAIALFLLVIPAGASFFISD